MDLWSEWVSGKKKKKNNKRKTTKAKSTWCLPGRNRGFISAAWRVGTPQQEPWKCTTQTAAQSRGIAFVQRDEQLVSVAVVEGLKITLPPLVFASPSLLSAKEEKRGKRSNPVQFDERAAAFLDPTPPAPRSPPGTIAHFKWGDAKKIQIEVSSSCRRLCKRRLCLCATNILPLYSTSCSSTIRMTVLKAFSRATNM